MKRIYLTFLLLLLPIVCSAAVVRPLTQDVATIQSVVSDLFGSLETVRTLNLTNSREIDNWLAKYNGSYTRASSQYVTDFEGIVREVPVDQIGIQGARLVRNWQVESNTLDTWRKLGGTLVNGSEVTFADTDGVLWEYSEPLSFEFSTVLSRTLALSLSSEYKRYSINFSHDNRDYVASIKAKHGTKTTLLFVIWAGVGYNQIQFQLKAGDSTGTVFLENPQVEIVTGQANQNPSEYVVNDGTDGSGYQWFDYENGNTVASNIVTAGMGASLDPDGFLQEPQATNLIAVGKYRLDSAWDIETATVTKDQTGIGGTPNSAVTMTDDSATVNETIQENIAISNDAVTRTASIFIKKNCGNHGIIFALSGGTVLKQIINDFDTATGVIVSSGQSDGESGVIDSGDWWRLWLSLTNNETGNTSAYIQIYPGKYSADGSNTGSIIADWAQIEVGSRPSSPVIGGATRAVSDFHFDNQGLVNDSRGAVYAEFMPTLKTIDNGTATPLLVGTGPAGRFLYWSGSRLSIYDGSSILTGLTLLPLTPYRASSHWSGIAMHLSLNGDSLSAAYDGSFAATPSSKIYIGSFADTFNSTIKKIQFFSDPKTPAYWENYTQ